MVQLKYTDSDNVFHEHTLTLQKIDTVPSKARKWNVQGAKIGDQILGNSKAVIIYTPSADGSHADTSNVIKVTTDGYTWTDVTLPILSVQEIIRGNDKFYAYRTYTDCTQVTTSTDGINWSDIIEAPIETKCALIINHVFIGCEPINQTSKKARHYTITGPTVSISNTPTQYIPERILGTDDIRFGYGLWKEAGKYVVTRYLVSTNKWTTYPFGYEPKDIKCYNNTYIMIHSDECIYTVTPGVGREFNDDVISEARAHSIYGVGRYVDPDCWTTVTQENGRYFVYGENSFTQSIDGASWSAATQLEGTIKGFAYIDGVYLALTSQYIYVSPKEKGHNIYSIIKGKDYKYYKYINVANGTLQGTARLLDGRYLQCNGEDDGLLTNYVFEPKSTDNWKIHINITNVSSDRQDLLGYVTPEDEVGFLPLIIEDNKLKSYLSSDLSKGWNICNNKQITDVETSENYILELERVGKKYTFSRIIAGEKTVLSSFDSSNNILSDRKILIGNSPLKHPFKGYIDLADCWFEINGNKTWYGLKLLEDTNLLSNVIEQEVFEHNLLYGTSILDFRTGYLELKPIWAQPNAEYYMDFTTALNIMDKQIILDAPPVISLYVQNGALYSFNYQNNSADKITDVSQETRMYVNCVCKNNTRSISYSLNNLIWTNLDTISDSEMSNPLYYGRLIIGNSSKCNEINTCGFQGSINLVNSYIKTFGTTICSNNKLPIVSMPPTGLYYRNIIEQGNLYSGHILERDYITGDDNINVVTGFTNESYGIIPRRMKFDGIDNFEMQLQINPKQNEEEQSIFGNENLFIGITSDNKLNVNINNIYNKQMDIPFDTWNTIKTEFTGASYNTYVLDNNKQSKWRMSDFSYTNNYTPNSDSFWSGITKGDKFVACSSSGATGYSTDGLNWTVLDNISLNTITYGGNKYVAVGNSGKIAYSTNGTNWTTITHTNNNWKIVCYGNMFICCDYHNISTSSDGITWNPPTAIDNVYIRSIKYDTNKQLYIAVGYRSIATTNKKVVCYSNNGQTWTVKELGNGSLNNVAIMPKKYNNDSIYVVCGDNGIFTSTDLNTWTQTYNGYDWTVAIYNSKNKKFYVFCVGKYISSSDGIIWQSEEIDIQNWVDGIDGVDSIVISGNKLQILNNVETWKSGLLSNTKPNNNYEQEWLLGNNSANKHPFNGSIDLNNSYIKFNNLDWWKGNRYGIVLNHFINDFTKTAQIRRYI